MLGHEGRLRSARKKKEAKDIHDAKSNLSELNKAAGIEPHNWSKPHRAFRPVGSAAGAFENDKALAAYVDEFIEREKEEDDEAARRFDQYVAKRDIEKAISAANNEYSTEFKLWILGRNETLSRREVTPWGPSSVTNLGIKGVENFALAENSLYNAFRSWASTMYMRGPKTQEEVEEYFRYLVWPIKECVRSAEEKFGDTGLAPADLYESPYNSAFRYNGFLPEKEEDGGPPMCLSPHFNPYMRPDEMYNVDWPEWYRAVADGDKTYFKGRFPLMVQKMVFKGDDADEGLGARAVEQLAFEEAGREIAEANNRPPTPRGDDGDTGEGHDAADTMARDDELDGHEGQDNAANADGANPGVDGPPGEKGDSQSAEIDPSHLKGDPLTELGMKVVDAVVDGLAAAPRAVKDVFLGPDVEPAELPSPRPVPAPAAVEATPQQSGPVTPPVSPRPAPAAVAGSAADNDAAGEDDDDDTTELMQEEEEDEDTTELMEKGDDGTLSDDKEEEETMMTNVSEQTSSTATQLTFFQAAPESGGVDEPEAGLDDDDNEEEEEEETEREKVMRMTLEELAKRYEQNQHELRQEVEKLKTELKKTDADVGAINKSLEKASYLSNGVALTLLVAGSFAATNGLPTSALASAMPAVSAWMDPTLGTTRALVTAAGQEQSWLDAVVSYIANSETNRHYRHVPFEGMSAGTKLAIASGDIINDGALRWVGFDNNAANDLIINVATALDDTETAEGLSKLLQREYASAPEDAREILQRPNELFRPSYLQHHEAKIQQALAQWYRERPQDWASNLVNQEMMAGVPDGEHNRNGELVIRSAETLEKTLAATDLAEVNNGIAGGFVPEERLNMQLTLAHQPRRWTRLMENYYWRRTAWENIHSQNLATVAHVYYRLVENPIVPYSSPGINLVTLGEVSANVVRALTQEQYTRAMLWTTKQGAPMLPAGVGDALVATIDAPAKAVAHGAAAVGLVSDFHDDITDAVHDSVYFGVIKPVGNTARRTAEFIFAVRAGDFRDAAAIIRDLGAAMAENH